MDNRRHPLHADREKVYKRFYYEQNRERLLAQFREFRIANPGIVKRWKRTEYEKNRDTYIGNAKKRKALLRGALTSEFVNRMNVYKRDGGKCHLCGLGVPEGDFHLDHLVPLSRGGEHSYSNVAVSHPLCNLRRGVDRMPAQLLLVG